MSTPRKNVPSKQISDHLPGPSCIISKPKEILDSKKASTYETAQPDVESAARDAPYEKFQCFPFKKYLQIPEKANRSKKPSGKQKIPSCTTGKDYRAHLVRVHKEKERLQTEKDRRKKERELKKMNIFC